MIGPIIAWILLGLIAGALARWILPGKDPMNTMLSLILGIVGAIVGGLVGRLLPFLPAGDPGSWLPGLGSILTATVGAILILFVVRLVTKRPE